MCIYFQSKLRSPAKIKFSKLVQQPTNNLKPQYKNSEQSNMKMEAAISYNPRSSPHEIRDTNEKSEACKEINNEVVYVQSDQKNDLQNNKNGIEVATAEKSELEDHGQNGKNEVQEMENFSLQLEVEENCASASNNLDKSLEQTQGETADLNNQAESCNRSSQSNTENDSVDVVESTTTEIVDKQNLEKDQEDQLVLSQDCNLSIKDVKVKLNDCLKEDNADQSASYAHKDVSFVKTLRTMSGRRSISRLRNVTGKDYQPSPNSSLYVNTSDVSISQDALNDKESYRNLRQRFATRELNSSNGKTESVSLKRKPDAEIENVSKKSKSEYSFLNSSFEFLKSFRNSNSETTACDLQETNHGVSRENKEETQDLEKRWCVIM